MKVYKQQEAFERLKSIVWTNNTDSFITVVEETAVHYGFEGGFNKTAAASLKIPTYDIYKNGGAMVTSPGDVLFCHMSKDRLDDFNDHIRKYLSTKIKQENVEIDNDLLVNGKKVAGFMEISVNNKHFYGGHISINCNLNLIKQICTKEMVKVPGGLGEYGITSEQVVSWLQEAMDSYK